MFIALIILLFCSNLWAQDTTLRTQDTTLRVLDTTSKAQDTKSKTVTKSKKTQPSQKKTISKTGNAVNNPQDRTSSKNNNNATELKVEYESLDSLRFEVESKSVILYKEAVINYDKINLKADKVTIRFNDDILEASGLIDSTGKFSGNPIFDDGDKIFKSKSMMYNYKTQRGLIQGVITEDEKGFIHGETVKKQKNNNINVKRGKFTTCNNEDHPHFAFIFSKAKLIPNDKIITGPANLVIEGVPTPIFLPFAIFPIKPGQRSGIIFPTYGESRQRGFYLENGGYYWALNDYMDFKLVGDIYTRGSWAIKPTMNYAKRYKYSGSLNLSYSVNKIGTGANFVKSKDFSIRWRHSQDAKAKPNSRFSANVNIMSSQQNKFNPTSTQDYLSNIFQSSISYQTKIAGKHQLTLNASHRQNTGTHMINITLPEVSFSVNRFYPFRKKAKTGGLKWYDNISVNYTMNSKNTINIADSLLFTPGALAQFKNGVQHNIPISSTIKFLKHFNLTTSLNFKDRWYFSKTTKKLIIEQLENGEDASYVKSDTIPGFNNVYDFSLNAQITTKLFKTINFGKNRWITAIRHVITPSVSFNYAPDFSEKKWGYYDYYYEDATMTDRVKYSYYDRYIYGVPGSRKQGRIAFSISNNLEMKVRSRKDSIKEEKKINLIDNFTINGYYDLTRDSLRWSVISMSGRTRLFDKLNITYRSTWDPYVVDSANRNLNQTEWSVNKRLFRLKGTNWSLGLDYRFKSKRKSGSNRGEVPIIRGEAPINRDSPMNKGAITDDPMQSEYDDIFYNPERYLDWNRSWSVNISYNLTHTTNIKYLNYVKEKNPTLVQTISVRGDISITPKWKLVFNTGYDFKSKRISYTSLNIYRDLHCWEMRFNWIPFGQRQSWNFTINVKSSVLQDLKLTKRKDFRDRF